MPLKTSSSAAIPELLVMVALMSLHPGESQRADLVGFVIWEPHGGPTVTPWRLCVLQWVKRGTGDKGCARELPKSHVLSETGPCTRLTPHKTSPHMASLRCGLCHGPRIYPQWGEWGITHRLPDSRGLNITGLGQVRGSDLKGEEDLSRHPGSEF